MFIIILGLIVIIGAVLVLYVRAKTPPNVMISRSLTISASPATLFPYINHPQRIQEWNPFIDKDPNVKLSFSGPAKGTGAQWAWAGTKAGAGQATILSSEANRRVKLRLDFERPFKVTNFGEYSLIQKEAGTEVTWFIDETAMIPRRMSVFLNLDKMIGVEFERGLLKLKRLAEKS